jgi:hypothetical protein
MGRKMQLVSTEIKNYADYMTAALFGYMYSGKAEDYVFGGKEIKYIKEDGEWVRKLYVDQGSPEIPCFDIELGENYWDGTRGNTSENLEAARFMKYQPEKVANRHRSDYKLPFFNDGTKGKFAVVDLTSEVPCPAMSEETINLLGLSGNALTSTISFYKFLEIYFQERGTFKFPGEK